VCLKPYIFNAYYLVILYSY